MDRGDWWATIHGGHKELDTTEGLTLSLSQSEHNFPESSHPSDPQPAEALSPGNNFSASLFLFQSFSLEIEEVEAEELKEYFPEFLPFEPYCRFRGCVHENEPDCAVKKAVKEAIIAKRRYDSYLLLYRDLKGKKKYKLR